MVVLVEEFKLMLVVFCGISRAQRFVRGLSFGTLIVV